jgi:FAD/FMN-containing dehydrogenase
MTIDTTAPSIAAELRAAIRGRVIDPTDADYDGARELLYGGLDKRPLAIARVKDAEDVAAVIRFVVEQGLPVSVLGGGHSITGASVVDDGIVVHTRDLRTIDVDADGRTAWVGAGHTAVEVSEALSEHGLAVGFGDTGSVGVGGITLGGGVGYLARKFGLTIDNLLAAEIVTADGEIREIDADHEPELFWAIRGGGGNFGVVTRFRFRLSSVPSFTGGLLIQPATPESVTAFVDAAMSALDDVTVIANVMPAPPMPGVPEEAVGKVVIFGIVAVAAADDEAARLLEPFRSAAKPIADIVQPIPYAKIYPPEDDSYHPLAVSRNLFVDSFDRSTAAGIMDRLQASDATLRACQIRPYGGAVSRVPNEATAYAHRDRAIMVNVAAFYEGDHDRAQRAAWVDEFADWLSGGDQAAYVNFLGDEGDARIRAAYPHGTYERLAEIKRRYDLDNLFQGNQNIPPAG